jgi:aldose sugar dehydrogenase
MYGIPRFTAGAKASLVLTLMLVGCQSPGITGAIEGESEGGRFKLETVAGKLVVPWAIAFSPDGRIFVTERVGRIRVIEDGKLRESPWAELNVDASGGEDGLMGIALAPNFAKTGAVYVVGTFSTDKHLINRVIRLTDRRGSGSDPVVIIDNIPGARIHAGDAIAFGPDGMLYVATGDVREPNNAQDLKSVAGKILRYRPDGTIPPDNPFPGSPVFALGVRNVQGLAWHPESHELFATDHGPSGFSNEGFRTDHDKLNVIRAGGNYGWPVVAGMNNDPRFIPPLTDWTPAIAPSGLAFYTGSEFPWKGNIFVGGLRGEQLRRVVLERAPGSSTGWRVVRQEALLHGELGRIRAVAMGPDGRLYFTTSNRDGRGRPSPDDDQLIRIVPKR